MLTVGKLKQMIANLSDDVIVLTPSTDHSYDQASLLLTTALLENKNNHFNYIEDYGENYTPEKAYGKRVQALVIK